MVNTQPDQDISSCTAFGLRWQLVDTNQALTEIDRFGLQAQPSGFQAPDWLADLLVSVARDPNAQGLFIIGYEGNGHPGMILPLCLRQELGTRRLEWLGQDISDYNVPIAKAPVFAALKPHNALAIWRIAAKIVGGVDVIVARKQCVEVFGHANAFAQVASHEETDKAYESVIADLTHPTGVTNTKSRRRLREKRNALAKQGVLAIGQAEPGNQTREALTRLVTLKSDQLHQSGRSNPFDEEGFLDFLERATQSGSLQVHCLWLDARAIAVTLLLKHDSVWHLYQTAYDNDFRRYSPGRILNSALIEKAHNHGCSVFDFGYGDDDYKRSLTNRELSLTASVISLTNRGHLAANIVRLSQSLRRTIKQHDWLLSMALSGNRWRRSGFGKQKAD